MEFDADIWRAAKDLIDLHGESAALRAAGRVAAFLKERDSAGAMIWTRVHGAVEELQRARREGEPLN